MKNYIKSFDTDAIENFRMSKLLKRTKFNNFQVDYIRLCTSATSKNDINWDNLIPHPKLKDNFTLNTELSPNAKNFNLYYGKDDCVFIKLSVPYFLIGHNYTEISIVELLTVKKRLKDWLNIDIHNAEILELEYGMFENIEITGKQYISNISNTQNFSLEKSTPYFKMFGRHSTKMHYKIYDAVANAKAKKVFTKADFPTGNIIKHELKFENVKKVYPNLLYCDLYERNFLHTEFKNLLFKIHEELAFKENLAYKIKKFDSVNILFTALKNLENRDTDVLELLNEMIDTSSMTSSQKSKRKKYFNELNNQIEPDTAF